MTTLNSKQKELWRAVVRTYRATVSDPRPVSLTFKNENIEESDKQIIIPADLIMNAFSYKNQTITIFFAVGELYRQHFKDTSLIVDTRSARGAADSLIYFAENFCDGESIDAARTQYEIERVLDEYS
jgi:hypothetical protein